MEEGKVNGLQTDLLSGSLQWGLTGTDLESQWLAERLPFLRQSLTEDAAWRHKVRVAFFNMKSDPDTES